MTYCVAIRLDDGLVFASDSRTSAGVDDVRTYSKMHIYEFAGQACLILMSAGNLATTQSVIRRIKRDLEDSEAEFRLSDAKTVFEAAEYIGRLNVRAQKSVSKEAGRGDTQLEASFILGGQMKGDSAQIFQIYPLGNCISCSPDRPFLQIGESKYGKPILDRIIRDNTSPEDAARCALVSLDSTMRSNVSVGPPIDLAIYRIDSLTCGYHERFAADHPYLSALRKAWARELERVFGHLPRFDWEAASGSSNVVPVTARRGDLPQG